MKSTPTYASEPELLDEVCRLLIAQSHQLASIDATLKLIADRVDRLPRPQTSAPVVGTLPTFVARCPDCNSADVVKTSEEISAEGRYVHFKCLACAHEARKKA